MYRPWLRSIPWRKWLVKWRGSVSGEITTKPTSDGPSFQAEHVMQEDIPATQPSECAEKAEYNTSVVPIPGQGPEQLPTSNSHGSDNVENRHGPVFALIIGIDEYISNEIPDLRGCVNDARAIKSFLSDQIHVPDSSILFLDNENATRSAIISSFQSHLTQNVEIESGDAILIFYAGHGSRVAAPDGWIAADGQIETLCPHDERMKDRTGEFVHGIPDRTINGLLHELSTVKGNNITVIIDSCHSGGFTRQYAHGVSSTARSVTTTCPIPATLDSALWQSLSKRAGHESIPAGFQYKSMSSHVLLAACRQDQSAYEVTSDEGGQCGFFTDALLKQLGQVRLDQITYSDLFDLLPPSIHQNPHCEGTNKNQILFRGKIEGRSMRTFMLVEKGQGVFEVKAGRVHGIVVGTEFAIQDQNAASPDVGVLVASSVNLTCSTLVPRTGGQTFTVGKGARALVYDWKNTALALKVFIEPDSEDQLAAIVFPEQDTVSPLQSDQAPQNRVRNLIKASSRSDAEAAIWLDSNGDVVIEKLDDLMPKSAHRTTSFRLRDRLEGLPKILNAVTDFNFHLRRDNGSSPLEGKVTMELYRLKGLQGYRVPDDDIGNLLVGNEAILVLDESAKYGVAIVNHSDYDLFLYLFYFDPLLYSIEAWYTPQAPLRALRDGNPTRVTAGYGAGSTYAFEFTLPSGRSSDTGFLKLFASTSQVDLDWIAQMSPLDPAFPARGWRMEARLTCIWDAWVAAVTVVDH